MADELAAAAREAGEWIEGQRRAALKKSDHSPKSRARRIWRYIEQTDAEDE